MDNKIDIKLEASPNDDLTIENRIFLSELVRNIKDETTTSGSEFEMDSKTNIKIEHNDSEVNLQHEGECLSTSLERNIKDDESTGNCDFKLDSKICIKEEPVILHAELPNEYLDYTTLGTKLKNDTITENDFEMNSKLQSGKQEFFSDITLQNDKKCFTLDLVKKIKKEAVICINKNEERTTKLEIEGQSQAPSLPGISEADENEESGSNKEQMVEDASPSESPRLNAEESRSNGLRTGFTDATLKDGNVYSLRSNRLHKVHGCKNVFSSNSYQRNNVLDKEGKKSICNICGTNLSCKSAFKTHKMIHKGIKLQKCEVCDKSFTQLGDLKRHKMIHEGIKPHKCDVCDKSFTRLGYLKIHKMIHEGIKPHKCDVCDKSFTSPGELKIHKMIHEGIKPHKCEVCDKSFTQLGNLKTHKMIHESIKPYRCEVCDKSFTQLGHFKRHKMIHESIKPHKCDVCDKSFTRPGDLKCHKMIHEGIKPHKCDVCDKGFTRMQNLKTHKLIHQSN